MPSAIAMSSNPEPAAQAKSEEEDFSWLSEPESQTSKLSRKIKENPVVPLGEHKFDL